MDRFSIALFFLVLGHFAQFPDSAILAFNFLSSSELQKLRNSLVMARLVTLKADKSLWDESHYKTHHRASTFNSYFKQYYPLNVLPFKHKQHNLKFTVTCRVRDKEIENLVEAQKNVNRFRAIEELDQEEGLVNTLEDEFVGGKWDKSAGFEWNWPPLKNIPQRYKVIGTTSLAFVICNMDKVTRRIFSCFFFS